MDEGDFTRGIQTQILKINKKEYTLASGFVGVEFKNEPDPRFEGDVIQFVKPAVGWFLYEEDPEKAKQGLPSVFISSDTAGAIFKN